MTFDSQDEKMMEATKKFTLPIPWTWTEQASEHEIEAVEGRAASVARTGARPNGLS
jgi:hypothetical protein